MNNKKNKVKLAVKVHSNPKMKKRKKTSLMQKEKDVPNVFATEKRKILRKKKSKKGRGFLEKEIKKKNISKKSPIKKEKVKKEKIEEEYFQEYSYQEEKSKVLLMKSGVTFFMLLIFIMWVYNTKKSIVNFHPKNENKKVLDLELWQKNLVELDDKVKNRKVILEKRKKNEINNDIKAKNESIEISTSSEEIEKLKEEINRIIK